MFLTITCISDIVFCTPFLGLTFCHIISVFCFFFEIYLFTYFFLIFNVFRYRNPGDNVKMVVAHLRKHTLNHVPGRHAGPPKQMPSWLSDGPRLLKIPTRISGSGGDEGISSPAGSPRAGSP